MGSQPPKEFRRIPGPVPGVWGFIVTVDDDVFRNSDDFPVEQVTKYADWAKADAGRAEGVYGEYIYTGPGDAPPGWLSFYFGPVNPNPTTPQRTTTDFGNHPWPDVLYEIDWYPELQFNYALPTTDGTSLGVQFARRFYERRILKPGVSEGSKFVTYEFFSALQFNIAQHPTPQPTEVQWEFLGQKGSFQGLHPTIDIDAKQSALTSWFSAGNTATPSIASDQHFPATNFEDWAPYCIHDQQKFVNIGWHETQVWVYPPPPPDYVQSL